MQGATQNPFVLAMTMGAKPSMVGLPDAAGASFVSPDKSPTSDTLSTTHTATPPRQPAPRVPEPPGLPQDRMAWRQSIKDIESSGGNYGIVGVETKGDRPYGAYQVMGNNVGPWTEKYVGRRMTPAEFLRDPAAQDAVFDGEFGSYVSKYGLQGAAQAWFGGPGSVGKADRKDVLGTSVGSYGERFVKGLGKGQNVALRNAEMMIAAGEDPQLRYSSKLFGGVRDGFDMTPGPGEQLQKQRQQTPAATGSGRGGGGSGGVQAQQTEASGDAQVQDEGQAYLDPVMEQLAARRQQSQQKQRRGAPQVKRMA